MKSLFNWSEVSRIISNDRSQITKSYKGKDYELPVKSIKNLENEIRSALTRWVIDKEKSNVKKC